MLSLTGLEKGDYPLRGCVGIQDLCGSCSSLRLPSLCFSSGNMSSHKGLNGTCSVHEYTGTFAGQTVRFKMTSVCGHVMTLDFLGELPTIPLPTFILPREALHSGAQEMEPGDGSGQRSPEPMSPKASRLWKDDLGSLGEAPRTQALEFSTHGTPFQ